jgi:tRNA(fMet)-specific endonuclease VapC
MTFLLDTDTLILLLRGTAVTRADTPRKTAVKRAAARILAKCRERDSSGEVIGLSAISAAELEYGLRHSGRYAEGAPVLRQVLAPFRLCPFDAVDCAYHYGIIRSSLEAKGQGIGPLDTLIAAHALALGAVLVTHNTREFRRIQDLVIEDWA